MSHEPEEESRQSQIPVEQDTIDFHGHPIVAVTLADGRIMVVMAWLCTGLNLDVTAQIRRVRRSPTVQEGELLPVSVDTDGGPQTMPALDLKMLAWFLVTIDPLRVGEDKRPGIVLFQRECADALYEYFRNKAVRVATAQHPMVVPLTPAQPAPPPEEADDLTWAAYYEEMALWRRWKYELTQQHRQTQAEVRQLTARVEVVEADVTAAKTEIGEVKQTVTKLMQLQQSRPLSEAHKSTAQHCCARLAAVTGRSRQAIWAEVNYTFHVSKYDRIPDAEWPQVQRWFTERIHAAGGKTDDLENEQGSLFES